MPYKRRKIAHRQKDVIPKTMTRTLVWESDICVPSNVPMTNQDVATDVATSLGFTNGDLTTYCPTYLAISANCPTDIFPNIPINASDGGKRLNFGSFMQPRNAYGQVISNTHDNETYTDVRKIGMMQTLHWRRQCPMGWREASKHYNKYRVQSSSISIDLVPQPVVGTYSEKFTRDVVAVKSEQIIDKKDTMTDYLFTLGQGSDCVTTVASLHQQHFRMPGEVYVQNEEAPGVRKRQIHLKRIITAGTMHFKDQGNSSHESRDMANYDSLANYKYFPPADTTANFHRRWPKTKQYVIPGFVDKITPWSHPRKRHMFRASWRCPAKKDAEERQEYEAYLTPPIYSSVMTGQPDIDAPNTSVIGYGTKTGDDKGRTVPQREQFYILRLGGQDVTYSTVKDTLAQQSNHASHTFHVRVSYNVMFFDRKNSTLNDIEETLDTTTDNYSADSELNAPLTEADIAFAPDADFTSFDFAKDGASMEI